MYNFTSAAITPHAVGSLKVCLATGGNRSQSKSHWKLVQTISQRTANLPPQSTNIWWRIYHFCAQMTIHLSMFSTFQQKINSHPITKCQCDSIIEFSTKCFSFSISWNDDPLTTHRILFPEIIVNQFEKTRYLLSLLC